MPSYLSDPDRWLFVPNPNYNGPDFQDAKRSQDIDAEKGIGAVYSQLKASGLWKVREFAFDKAKWPNASAADEWVRDNRQAFKSFEVPPVRVECFEVAFPRRANGSAPTEDELAAINSMALEPLDAADVYVRTMRLTNDQWGKHHVRLSRGFQRNVIGTIPGKSLLLGHPEVKSIAAEPIGRFFQGWVDRDAQGTEWGYAKFYLVRTAQNEHARAQIDGGVWQYASIGMELDWRQCSVCGLDIFDPGCPHIPGQPYPAAQAKDLELDPQPVQGIPDSIYCGLIYRGQGSAIEGSIVYLPELNGTEIVAEAQQAIRQAYHSGDFGQAKALMLSQVGDGTGAAHQGDGKPGDVEPIEAPHHENEEAEAMSEERVKTLEAEAMTAAAEKAALEAKLAAATEALEKTKAEHAALETAQRETEPVIAAEKAFRAAAVAEVERLAKLVGRDGELSAFKSMAGEDLAGLPAEKVLGVIDDWVKAFDAQKPPVVGRQSTPSEQAGDDSGALSVDITRLAAM